MSACILKHMNNFFSFLVLHNFLLIKSRNLLQYFKLLAKDFREISLGILTFWMYLKICVFCTISRGTLKNFLLKLLVPRDPVWGTLY